MLGGLVALGEMLP